MAVKINPLPPIERLRELLSYDEVTGVLRWKVYRSSNARAGDVSGSINSQGHRYIGIDGEVYAAHRIAYAMYHGIDPWPHEIDHDNRNPGDNSIGNLILSTREGNCKNRDFTNIVAHLSKLTEAKKKPVKITYPDGEVFIAPSIVAAAKVLGVTHQALAPRLKRGDGVIKTRGGKPTGITIAYA